MGNRLWIAYAWADNVEGDFDYLVQELERVGLDARYDRVELTPVGNYGNKWEIQLQAGHLMAGHI